MEPLTLAGIATIVITGALTRVGEITLDGTISKLKQLIERKHPETLQQLEAAASNPELLAETIEVMATVIENDDEVKEVAEQVAQENENKPYVINQFTRLEKILNFANRDVKIGTQNNTF